MTAVGELALWAALPLSLWGCALAFLGLRWGRGELALSAERSVFSVTLLLSVAAAGLGAAFLSDRFEYLLVQAHSSLELPGHLKVAAVWAGSRGALLASSLGLALLASLAVVRHRRDVRDLLAGALAWLLALVSLALVLLNFLASPFERAPLARLEGAGLDADLQSPWMAIQPPLVLLAFAAFAVAFAFAASALHASVAGDRWLRPVRRWTLGGWTFLSGGIVVGMRWAYETPDWGRGWSWDPAESAVLLPWLAATALLCSAAVQRRGGFPRAWNVALAAVPFFLALLAGFLGASGLVPSARMPAPDPAVARSLLALLAATAVLVVFLVGGRLGDPRGGGIHWAPLSREAALLTAHLALLGFAFVVLAGLLLPLLAGGIGSEPVEVGPAWFAVTALPLGFAAFALLGVGPCLAWGRTRAWRFAEKLTLPAAAGSAAGAGVALAGLRDSWAVATFFVGGFALAALGRERLLHARRRPSSVRQPPIEGLPEPGPADRSGRGAAVAFLGIVLVAVGLAGSRGQVEAFRSLDAGEAVEVRSTFGRTYTLTYEGLSTSRTRNAWEWTALFSVRRDGTLRPPLAARLQEVLVPRERRSRPGIRTEGPEDLHVILQALEGPVSPGAAPDSERAAFDVGVRPLASAIWVGGLLTVMGGLLSLLAAPCHWRTPSQRPPPVGARGEE